MRKMISALLLLLPCTLAAQRADGAAGDEVLPLMYAGSHWSYTFTSSLTRPAKVQRQSGGVDVGATAVSGFQFGVNLHVPIDQAYSLITGLHLGESGRDYTFTLPKEAFQPALEADYQTGGLITQSADFYLSLPLLLEKRWLQRSGHHWNLQGGLNLRYAFEDFTDNSSGTVVYGSGQREEVYRFDLTIGSGNKPWVNYNLGGGYTRALRNLNLLRLNLVVNYSPKDIVRGTYTVTAPNIPATTGTYAADLSHAGLSFSYILTRTRKRMRRL